MLMNHVRRTDELNAARLQLLMSGRDIRDTQVQRGFRGSCLRLFGQHQPDTAAIEKCELAKGVEVGNAKRCAVPGLRLGDVAAAARGAGHAVMAIQPRADLPSPFGAAGNYALTVLI